MTQEFFKYQGTGNDFVLIDNRDLHFDAENIERIAWLCDRKFGIGADGLMLLQNKEGYDFEMVYFNADGRTSSMCGNGGRCITAFAKKLGVISDRAHFLAIDGPHEATVSGANVSLKMQDVAPAETLDNGVFLDTGSPHVVSFVDDVQTTDVVSAGREIRNSDRFREEGTNVNFVERTDSGIRVRTYERGVEDETLSCGTGVTACALATASTDAEGNGSSAITTPGGNLEVRYHANGNGFTDIWLEGPATFVFQGSIELPA